MLLSRGARAVRVKLSQQGTPSHRASAAEIKNHFRGYGKSSSAASPMKEQQKKEREAKDS